MRLIIIGAGGHGQSVREVALALKKYVDYEGQENILFLDDRYGESIEQKQMYKTIEYEIVGKCDEYDKFIEKGTEFYPAFGDNKKRLKWEEKISQKGGKLAIIIHPTAYIAKSATISSGTVVFPNAMINTGCVIGPACIINAGSIIDHGCILNEGCHINVGAIVKAESNVPKYTKVDYGNVFEL